MNNATLTGTAAFLLLVSTTLTAANDVFTGYFVDEQRTVAVEMEYFEGAYSGVITDGADIFYELVARLDGSRLVGQVIADGKPVAFVAENHGSFLVYTIDGVGYKFYRFEPDTGEATQPSEQHGSLEYRVKGRAAFSGAVLRQRRHLLLLPEHGDGRFLAGRQLQVRDGMGHVALSVIQRGARTASCPVTESQSVSMDVSLQL